MAYSVNQSNSRYLFDFLLSASVLVLIIFGCLFIYSSGYVVNEEVNTTEFTKQLVWIAISIAGATVIFMMNMDSIERLSTILYLLVVAMLVVTLFIGKEVNGAKSWLGIGPIGLQFSEFAKLVLVLLLADRCAANRENIKNLGTFAGSFAWTLLPMGLILLQPDLGTAIIFPFLTLGILYIAGARLKHILFVLGVLFFSILLIVMYSWYKSTLDYLPSAFFIITDYLRLFIALGSLMVIIGVAYLSYYYFRSAVFYWLAYGSALFLSSLGIASAGIRILREYQLSRLTVFLNPYQDPQGSGWHIIQALTAIGSGGFSGKGYLQGTQSHFQFIPEQNTDFIFSILAEEWGFLGVIILFAAYGITIYRVISIANTVAHQRFQFLVCAGIATLLILHFTINIGVVLGLLPIIGIPLFFLSYGGSSLLMILSGIALVLNCYANRYRTY